MIVMKFGGTSVESAAAIERVAGIVAGREARRPVVVVSAMGKTTNKLLAIAEPPSRASATTTSSNCRPPRLITRAKRGWWSRSANAPSSTAPSMTSSRSSTELVKGLAVLGELTPRSIDAISSYGERLSSYIVTLAFRHSG